MADRAPGGTIVEVNFDRVRQEISWWLDDQAAAGVGRVAALERLAVEASTSSGSVGAFLAGREAMSPARAERILDALGYRGGVQRSRETGRLLPLAIRSRYAGDGRARQPGETGRLKKLEYSNAKLSEQQLRAIHRLHIDGGLSLREICRRGWEEWGFASESAAVNSVSSRLRSMGLRLRPRAEATALANRSRPGVTKPAHLTRNEWRRQQRAVRRATDPAFRAEEAARLAALHQRERQTNEEDA